MLRTRSRAPSHAPRPLLRYLTDALSRSGCELLHVGSTRKDAVRLSYEDPLFQRVGLTGQLLLLGYHTQNHAGASATIQAAAWPGGTSPCDPDPFGLFTPVLLGVDPARDLFVAFDPGRHFPDDDPLHVSISATPLRRALMQGWHAWEREEYARDETGFAETLVGFTAPNLVHYVAFERLAAGLDTGPRQLLAERYFANVMRRGERGRAPRRLAP